MIDSFCEEFDFLSNFYDSPITASDGITYPTVEHYFQAQKTLNLKERRIVAAYGTPGLAKRAGRRVMLRPDWEEVKEKVMLEGLRAKFSDSNMAKKLLATGDEFLIEGNWWHDNYWGSCNCPRCGNSGKNVLGKLLMQLREELRKS